MANTLTALLPVLYKAAQVVPREMVGFIGSVDTSFDAKQVALNDSVKVPIVSASAIGDYTPGMTTSAGSNSTPTTTTLTMSYSKEVTWHLTGEEQQSLENGGDNAMEFMRQKTEGGLRTLTNYFEGLLAIAVKNGASRATGTAGTTPFASSVDALADAQQILIDNGCPMNDGNVSAVLSSVAANKLKKLVTINNQPSGSPAEQILRSGTFVNLYGMNVKESAQAASHTKGTATGIDVNNGAGYVAGDVTIVSHGSDSGTVLAGDVVTWAGDANKYVLTTSSISGAATGNVVLNSPGLRAALADTTEMTIGANYIANSVFHRSAVKLVIRPPFMPANANIATELITDPVSGLTFAFCKIAGDGMITYAIRVVGGLAVVQPALIATILG